jgi:hypothetical protein
MQRERHAISQSITTLKAWHNRSPPNEPGVAGPSVQQLIAQYLREGVAPSSTPAAADTSRKTAGMAELSCSQIPRDRIPTSVSALGNNMVQLLKKRRLFATGARVKAAR